MRVLLTNPEVDEITYYLFAWTDRMLRDCRQKHDYYWLKRGKAVRKHFEKVLRKRDIDLVLLCGHGEENKVFGDSGTILDKDNVELLEGKVVHALSCRSADGIGKTAVANGAKGYIGYRQDFIMFFNDDNNPAKPLEDPTAALFLDAAFTAPKGLLNGHSSREAFEATKKEYNRSIKKALSSDIQSNDDLLVTWLYWDRDNLALIDN